MYGFTVLSCIVGYDIWFYFSHILLHQPFLYKTIHHFHHDISYPTMTFMDTYVGHWAEGPFQGLGLILPFVFLPWDPYSCLVALVFVNVRGMMRHDHRCSWLIGKHHLLHHKHPRYNYGEKWLDSLFGTLCKPMSSLIHIITNETNDV